MKKKFFFGFISKCKRVSIFHKYIGNVIKIVQERVLKSKEIMNVNTQL